MTRRAARTRSSSSSSAWFLAREMSSSRRPVNFSRPAFSPIQATPGLYTAGAPGLPPSDGGRGTAEFAQPFLKGQPHKAAIATTLSNDKGQTAPALINKH